MTQRNPPVLSIFSLLLAASGCGAGYVPQRVASNAEPEASYALAPAPAGMLEESPGEELYAPIKETGFQPTSEFPRSTFSVDVDTAAYANVRRFLKQGQRPPADAVRVEELINYFDYDYPEPEGPHPIAVSTELATSPFHPRYQLLRVALSTRDLSRAEDRPARNLVFLVDVSGSMHSANKLPLVQASLELLTSELDARDTVSIVVYAGGAGVVLLPTPGSDKARIRQAIRELQAGGSTHGAAGIELAYDLAVEGLQPGASNRVILATDGDFNVGVTSHEGLLQLIERRREQGVYLSVLGFGMGNLKDATMELLADHGNGNYAYIDTLAEARKVLVDQLGATLDAVAKDAKLQLTWNEAEVARYRLIGYENRRLRDEDFSDDQKDAGDLGSGHRVTALYEIERVSGARSDQPIARVAVRYKRPQGGGSELLTHSASGHAAAFERASEDLRFSAAVAGFGMLLRDSPHRGAFGFEEARRIAQAAVGRDAHGRRRELVALVAEAQELYGN